MTHHQICSFGVTMKCNWDKNDMQVKHGTRGQICAVRASPRLKDDKGSISDQSGRPYPMQFSRQSLSLLAGITLAGASFWHFFLKPPHDCKETFTLYNSLHVGLLWATRVFSFPDELAHPRFEEAAGFIMKRMHLTFNIHRSAFI